MKYKELISTSKEDQQEQQLNASNERAKLQIQSDILETQLKLSQSKEELLKAKSAVPFKSSIVIKQLDEVASLEAGLKALNDLQTELFWKIIRIL